LAVSDDVDVTPFDVHHHDPLPVARAAAVSSRAEQDPRTRDRARTMTRAQRLREGFALSRFASRIAGAASR